MKFLCLHCDRAMGFAQRQLPGDGTMTAVFTCPGCSREVAMLTNPMETQFVSTMGVEIGGRTVPAQPLEQTRTSLDRPRDDAFGEPEAPPVTPPPPTGSPAAPAAPAAVPAEASAPAASAEPASDPAPVGRPPPRPRVTWSEGAVDRLGRVPRFVRGMVKRIYTEYAQEEGIPEITVEVMDRARSDLGLEGM